MLVNDLGRLGLGDGPVYEAGLEENPGRWCVTYGTRIIVDCSTRGFQLKVCLEQTTKLLLLHSGSKPTYTFVDDGRDYPSEKELRKGGYGLRTWGSVTHVRLASQRLWRRIDSCSMTFAVDGGLLQSQRPKLPMPLLLMQPAHGMKMLLPDVLTDKTPLLEVEHSGVRWY